MINVTKQVLLFRKFLLSSWDDLNAVMKKHDWSEDFEFMHDWLQMNWELLVEKQILKGKGILDSYMGGMTRILSEKSCSGPRYVILCKPKPGQVFYDYVDNLTIPKDEALIFWVFCEGYLKLGSGIYPPFEGVGVLTTIPRRRYKGINPTLPVDAVDFFLCRNDEVFPETPKEP